MDERRAISPSDRSRRSKRTRTCGGYSAIELLFAASTIATIGSIAVAQLLTSVDDFRTAGAARYVSSRLQHVRMEAVVRSAESALQVTQIGSAYSFAGFVDGNRNGVRTKEIQSGIDRNILPIERLPDRFAGVEFGAIPGLPAVDPSGTPPGVDPIRLGASNLASFAASGTSSSGSLYIRGGHNAQYAVRIYGQTGKTRVLKYDLRSGRWKPI